MFSYSNLPRRAIGTGRVRFRCTHKRARPKDDGEARIQTLILGVARLLNLYRQQNRTVGRALTARELLKLLSVSTVTIFRLAAVGQDPVIPNRHVRAFQSASRRKLVAADVSQGSEKNARTKPPRARKMFKAIARPPCTSGPRGFPRTAVQRLPRTFRPRGPQARLRLLRPPVLQFGKPLLIGIMIGSR